MSSLGPDSGTQLGLGLQVGSPLWVSVSVAASGPGLRREGRRPTPQGQPPEEFLEDHREIKYFHTDVGGFQWFSWFYTFFWPVFDGLRCHGRKRKEVIFLQWHRKPSKTGHKNV